MKPLSFLLVTGPLVAAACDVPNLPVLSDAGGDANHSDAGDDSPSRESGTASGIDATMKAAEIDSGGGLDATTSGSDGEAGVCTLNETKCAGTGVQTCGPGGQWGSATQCPSSQCNNGACVPITSCQAGGFGLTNCGASSESCCTSLEVPGGTFFRTYDNAGDGGVDEADPATVSGFRLDKYLVTVGRFRQFVSAWNGGYAPPPGSGKHTHLNGGQGLANCGGPGTYEPGWLTSDNSNIDPIDSNLTVGDGGMPCVPGIPGDSTWTPSVSSQENLPMVCENWYEAYAFCIWDGGFLPSNAEWEYATAGGSQQREFPWGSADPGTGEYLGAALAPVGLATQGAGRWGQLDLMNHYAYEWMLDWYGPYIDPCIDCANLTNTDSPGRVFGGLGGLGEGDIRTDLDATDRQPAGPAARVSLTGFRCARTP